MSNKKAFRKLVRRLESSDGLNTAHKPISSGIHRGTAAIGDMGLMPVTAQDLSKQDKDLVSQILQGIDPRQVGQVLQDNPNKYNELVDKMINTVQERSSDPVDQYVRYNFGQNLSPERLEQIKATHPEFINKIEREMVGLKSEPETFVETLPELEKPTIKSQPRKLKRLLGE